jgi:Tol biopolymer transport system component
VKAERWEQIKRLCSAALEVDAARREQFLAEACAGDPLLRKEIESLLAQQSAAEDFIESPALDFAARELAREQSREPLADLTGRTLLHFRVEEKIGEGGMGVVYRARDTHLGRNVAIKVLPEAFSGDRERMARFEREARLLASLNHPNVAAIHSIEKIEKRRFLVLELVEGETLAQRIAKGPLPMEEALEICRQVAEGLEAAHEKGIIHRDLKPANIKITPQGKVKVLDFGLAKPLADERGAIDLSQSPTITDTSTHPGVILGTAAYMSPEQASGKPTDKRTDIWAFGCVLYECLTGKRAFPGETMTEIMASILRNEPDWTMLAADTPRSVRTVLRRCLEKDPALRLHDIADARIELREPFPELAATVQGRSSRLLVWGGYALAALAVAGLVLTLVWRGSQEAVPPPAAVHTLLPPPAGYAFGGGVAVSPDGSKLAAVVINASRAQKLWVRSLSAPTEQILPDTDGAAMPFWSADSKSIGFFAGGKLKTISAVGGSSRTLDNVTLSFGGGTWNAEGTILFCPTNVGVLYCVPAQGGSSRAVTRMGQEDRYGHMLPRFLADGRHFLYRSLNRADSKWCIYLGSLDSPDAHVLLSDVWASDFAPPDYLLFLRMGNLGSLMAQRFDFARHRPLAEPVPVADNVGGGGYNTNFSVSGNGVLVYGTRTVAGTSTRRLIWRGRDGSPLGSPIEPGVYGHVFLSPNEKQASVTQNRDRVSNIWLWPFDTNILSPLTFETDSAMDPIWSPDSIKLVYQIYLQNKTRLMILTLGERSSKLLLDDGKANFPDDWSPDGKWILGRRQVGGKTSVILIAADGSAPPKVLLDASRVSTYNLDQFQFSPDGQWVAYNSDESGRMEVYVARFPSISDARMVSNAGGCQPIWRKDGKELFYLSLDAKMMSVLLVKGATLQADAPKILFQSRVRASKIDTQYAVGANGQKFLLIEAEPAKDPLEAREPLHVITNWQAALRR